MKYKKLHSHPVRLVIFLVASLVAIAAIVLVIHALVVSRKLVNTAPYTTSTMQNAKEFVAQFYNKYDAELSKEDNAGGVNLQSKPLESIVKSYSEDSFYDQYLNQGAIDYSKSSSFQNIVTCSDSIPNGAISIVTGIRTSDGDAYEITISEPFSSGNSWGTSSFSVRLTWNLGFRLSQVYC